MRYAVTFSGVSNGNCTDCSFVDSTWHLGYLGACNWVATAYAPCNHATTGLTLAYIPCDNVFQLTYGNSPGIAGLAVYEIPASQWNCLGQNTLTLVSTKPDCSNWPSSVTVIPE
jgi:hypothetical protein